MAVNLTRSAAEAQLQNIFHIDHFYDDQWQTIDQILKGNRILLIERTGFGKSLCYQFPAVIFSGTTVVFSPLIALMRDQVRKLKSLGISAEEITSAHTDEENNATINKVLSGQLKIIYIAPERQESEQWIKAAKQINLSMVVIDEAHCISTWGHDFRPAFRHIIDLVKLLPANFPVLATTATATRRVQKDIEQQIGSQFKTIRGSLYRPNLALRVLIVHSEGEKLLWIAENIKNLPGTGIIYVGTTADTELYSAWLNYLGISAIGYSGRLHSDTRINIENGLINNKWKCVVSTNALGMGIDKSDLRFIIHAQIPQSPIHYFQEIGRAGRDGQPAEIVLLYNESVDSKGKPVDKALPFSFIEKSRPEISVYQRVISLLKNDLLGETAIQKAANLKKDQFKIIKADLLEQNIIRQVKYYKSKKYEYISNALPLNTALFEELRENKLKDLDHMIDYVYTSEPRMQYLCRYLDSDEEAAYQNCDNTNLPKLSIPSDQDLKIKLKEFYSDFYPVIDTSDTVTAINDLKIKVRFAAPNIIDVFLDDDNVLFSIDTLKNTVTYYTEREYSQNEIEQIRRSFVNFYKNKSRLTQGYAVSFYGTTKVGKAIHNSKYCEGGDFPDFIVKRALELIHKNYHDLSFDLVVFIPPTKSGPLVRNFATKIADALDIPLGDVIVKVKATDEQKIFQNSDLKKENVQNAFSVKDADLVQDKTLLLIDDVYDSGATLKEAGRTLTKAGAKWIVPLVLAKTVGGTL